MPASYSSGYVENRSRAQSWPVAASSELGDYCGWQSAGIVSWGMGYFPGSR